MASPLWIIGSYGDHRSYLSIVLKHLIALHVVTLEHDNRPVEAGDVQAEVICSDFFIRSVGEHLEKEVLLDISKTNIFIAFDRFKLINTFFGSTCTSLDR